MNPNKYITMKQIHLFYLLIILTLNFNNSIIAQDISNYSISGIITDKKSNEPLVGVNVFLNGTTLGSSSNKLGEYKILNVPPGTYRLVVSMIGYKSRNLSLSISAKSLGEVNFKLNPISYELSDVNIVAERDEEWLENMRRFRNNFIGTSENSENCIIINREIIDFIKLNNGDLTASAPTSIIILNDALGYKLKFDLKEFRLAENGEVDYSGDVWYEKLVPRNEFQEEEWIEKRLYAYKGSLKHFLISLCRKSLFEEGFLTYNINYPTWSDLRRRNFSRPDHEEMIYTISTLKREITFDNYIKVVYLEEYEESEYKHYRNEYGSTITRELDEQTSWIYLPFGYAIFDINGNVVDDYHNIKVYGYWAWLKVADMLPMDYLPED
ncbi:MAG: carboxypeptidase-like regulatory domain-containing protein [Melioribacteraceae bacterium]|nr:carboxypeptidase-like regulatory domain-containing protein [Melioribacteraceae bacterium]